MKVTSNKVHGAHIPRGPNFGVRSAKPLGPIQNPNIDRILFVIASLIGRDQRKCLAIGKKKNCSPDFRRQFEQCATFFV